MMMMMMIHIDSDHVNNADSHDVHDHVDETETAMIIMMMVYIDNNKLHDDDPH